MMNNKNPLVNSDANNNNRHREPLKHDQTLVYDKVQ